MNKQPAMSLNEHLMLMETRQQKNNKEKKKLNEEFTGPLVVNLDQVGQFNSVRVFVEDGEIDTVFVKIKTGLYPTSPKPQQLIIELKKLEEMMRKQVRQVVFRDNIAQSNYFKNTQFIFELRLGTHNTKVKKPGAPYSEKNISGMTIDLVVYPKLEKFDGDKTTLIQVVKKLEPILEKASKDLLRSRELFGTTFVQGNEKDATEEFNNQVSYLKKK